MIQFSVLLASIIHDMKNSMSLMLKSLEDIADDLPEQQSAQRKQINALHYETSKLNTQLVRILALYRTEQDKMPLNIDELFLDDLAEELIATNLPYFHLRNIQIDTDIEPDLAVYADHELMVVMLNDIVVNAMRYCKQRIRISAWQEVHWRYIKIEDDGQGYPEPMLVSGRENMQDFDISQGRTGLGLYFAQIIAATHQRQGRNGYIELTNGGSLGGSVFTLALP